jgi:CBS domain-containing protein
MTDTASDKDDFQDPLENYEPKQYSDPLEQAFAEEELATIRHEPFATISPDTLVHQAVEKLNGMHIACLLVVEEKKLVGVFSERDVLLKVALEYDKVKDRPVREVMTSDPIFVNETDSAVVALSVMAQCGYRHVPVLDLNDNLVGIISPQRVTEFLQSHFSQE